jgi:hypothetical protein
MIVCLFLIEFLIYLDRIQSGVLDNETKIVLEKMELLHERVCFQ